MKETLHNATQFNLCEIQKQDKLTTGKKQQCLLLKRQEQEPAGRKDEETFPDDDYVP